MPETQMHETAREPEEYREDRSEDREETNAVRRAAAVEAAYILEAVRG